MKYSFTFLVFCFILINPVFSKKISKDVQKDDFTYSHLIKNVNVKQVKAACLKIIKGDGTWKRRITKNEKSIIECYSETSKNYATFSIVQQGKDVMFKCKINNPLNQKQFESSDAKTWGEFVVKKFE